MKLLILLLGVGLGSIIQRDTPTIKKSPCTVFKSAGKLIDTVSINADLLEVEMSPHGSPALMYLERKMLLPARHHYYSIKLHSNNCDVDYWLTCGDNSEEARMAINKNAKKVKLTCIIFRDHKLPGNIVPFVVVTKLRTD